MAHTISSQTIPDQQYQWLVDEKKRTGRSYNMSIRELIQEKVDKEKRAKK